MFRKDTESSNGNNIIWCVHNSLVCDFFIFFEAENYWLGNLFNI